MSRLTRRSFLRLISRFGAMLWGVFYGLGQNRILRADESPSWGVRRATVGDEAALTEIFNLHRTTGLCPGADSIEPWDLSRASNFIRVYNGSLVLSRNGMPVGFAGLIDYSDPTTESEIAPGVIPEVRVFALDPTKIDGSELVSAAKTLGLAVGRELQRLGFTSCRARIRVEPMFDSWYLSHMTVVKQEQRPGENDAQEVVFEIAAGLAELETSV